MSCVFIAAGAMLWYVAATQPQYAVICIVVGLCVIAGGVANAYVTWRSR